MSNKSRDLILGMSISLDGFIAGPNDELDWVFQASTPDSQAWAVERCANAGIHLLGSKTFATFVGYWPTATGPFAEPMNTIPKVVYSRSGQVAQAEHPTWKNARIISGNLVGEVAALKREEGKPIGVGGGVAFAQALVRANLVDEFQLAVHPIALGRGKSLFETLEARLALQLVDVKKFSGGILGMSYRRR